MVATVKMCINSLDYAPENICLIARENKYLDQLKSMIKEELDLDCAFTKDSDFDFAKPGIIRLATPQSCKGLDFPVVLFYLDHCVPLGDVYDEEVADKMNRNMIYTAITRSIELLHVFILEDGSEKPVCDLRDILKTV